MSFQAACIGAAHLDRTARALEAVVPGSSNPVVLHQSIGGVARNVAENLARLGAAVAMVSAVGRDEAGAWVLARCAEAGLDMRQAARLEDAATASYTALLEPSGELAVAFADMAIYDRLRPGFLAPRLRALPDCRIWFADANPPAEGLAAIAAAKPAGTLLAADCVSVAKARRLAGLLDRLDLLFCNADEAAALAGLPAGTAAADSAARLLAGGARALVVTQGPRGCLVAADGAVEAVPAAPAAVRDVTGAGDSLIAGTLWGLGTGLPLMEAVRLGRLAAAVTLEYDGAIHPDLGAVLRARSTPAS
ncbi:MAG TPA: PfkB family carbohydrate kinase [Alphaproteobacteria bacterium]|nr:PfkB family carbohydrate kinase [Alphaproteobacteria bacterium]